MFLYVLLNFFPSFFQELFTKLSQFVLSMTHAAETKGSGIYTSFNVQIEGKWEDDPLNFFFRCG